MTVTTLLAAESAILAEGVEAGDWIAAGIILAFFALTPRGSS